jgi:O-antigen ligase
MFEIVKDYPIIGIGFGMGTYKKHIDFIKYREKVPAALRSILVLEYPHSMLIDLAIRVGIVGLILFLYIMYVFIKMCWRIIRYGKEDCIKQWSLCILSAFIMFLFIGIFEPVFVHMIEVVFFTILSMGTIVYRLNANSVLYDDCEC